MDKTRKCNNVVIETGYTSGEHETLLSQSLYAPNVINIYDPPNDYKIAVTLSAIFCFVPLGALGMYYSSKVISLHRTGNFAKAARTSKTTKLILQLTIIIGSGLWLVGTVILIRVLSNH